MQIPLTTVFAKTDYKIQGEIVMKAIFDLQHDNFTTDSNHKVFCSTYI